LLVSFDSEVRKAQPPRVASEHSVDYTCGH
jgi:hypothetical protein